jgi:alanyl-tRNA synthetase
VINGALRKILGVHIWQAGSQLNVENARFDYAHYIPLTSEEQQQVEDKANDLINQHIDVHKKLVDRNTAEKTYGFRLYQGGVPPGNSIRVLDIPGVDVEACGGTHLNNIGEIEQIKIIRSERIQDGVNRIIFAAGPMVEAYEKEERQQFDTIMETLTSCYTINEDSEHSQQLEKACEIFSVPVEQMPRTIKRFIKEANIKGQHEVDTLIDACEHLFSTWKQAKKQEKSVSKDEIEALRASAAPVPGTTYQVITGITGTDANALAGAIIAQGGYIVHLYDGSKITSAASEDVPIDLRTALVPTLSKILGGGGGGRPRMIQCGGPNKESIHEALQKAKELTIKSLQ